MIKIFQTILSFAFLLSASIADAGTAVVSLGTASINKAISSSCGSYSSIATTYTNVTNLSVTITTGGRPVYIAMVPDGAGVISSYATTASAFDLQIYNSTGSYEVGAFGVNSNPMTIPPGVFDFVSAGTYTYVVRVRLNTGSLNLYRVKLLAFEL